jgi:hypothetical protein
LCFAELLRGVSHHELLFCIWSACRSAFWSACGTAQQHMHRSIDAIDLIGDMMMMAMVVMHLL